MTLNKPQLIVARIVVLLVCLGLLAWMWRQSERARRPPTADTWVEKLQSGDPDDRMFAIQELSSVSAEHAEKVAPALTAALSDRESPVRNEAVLALGRYMVAAVKSRGSALTDQSRAAAGALIGVIKNDGDSSVRASAAFAVSTLRRALAEAGIHADAKRGDDPIDPKMLAKAFDTALERDPKSRMAFLVPYEGLGPIGQPAPAPVLAGLDDSSPDVRKLVLQVLSQFTTGSDQAVPVLLKDAELKAPPSGIKAAKGAGPGSALHRAAQSLHPTKAVVPILVKALESQNPDVRQAAVLLLGGVGPDGRSTAPALIAAAKDLLRSPDAEAKDKGPQFSDYATAIARVAPPGEAVSFLSQAMGSEDPTARSAAVTALGKLGTLGQAAVPILLKALKTAGKPAGRSEAAFTAAVVQSLGQIAPGASLPKPTEDEIIASVSSCLDASANFLRIAAAKALGEFGPRATGALPKLKELAQNDQAAPAAREAASDAIVKIELKKSDGA
jgi:HEAT repeat protein